MHQEIKKVIGYIINLLGSNVNNQKRILIFFYLQEDRKKAIPSYWFHLSDK